MSHRYSKLGNRSFPAAPIDAHVSGRIAVSRLTRLLRRQTRVRQRGVEPAEPPRGVPRPARPLRAVAAAFCCVSIVAVIGAIPVGSASAGTDPANQPGAIAVIQRTEGGIAHISARNLYGVGYGQGYVEAQDNFCVLADAFVTYAAQRSRYFGPDATYLSPGNQVSFNNLASDFAYQRINDEKLIERLLDQPPPNGPTEQARQAVAGFAAGYDRLLRDIGGPAGVQDPACHGNAWVRPITDLDVWRRIYSLAGLESFQYFTQALVDAVPPAPTTVATPSAATASAAAIDPQRLRRALPVPGGALQLGSNGYAIGGTATVNGTGMLLANPHFPWQGIDRYEQFELSIPGQLDVAGGALLGLPGINIGHTQGLAWTHTSSTAWRFTPYQLTLVPGDPTSYIVDGQVRHMQTRTVDVTAQGPDGAPVTREHTFYETQWGPVLDTPALLLQWTPATAYALADANATNIRLENTSLVMDQAQNVTQLRAAEQRFQGLPWVNTVATDRIGVAYYADQSVVPDVPSSLVDRCLTAGVGTFLYQAADLPVLDGSQSQCRWQHDPDAVDPGTFGPAELPRLSRPDFVGNSNDSYWLVNPYQTIEGYPRIIGSERTELSLRTQVAMTMMTDRIAGTDGLPGRGFTLQDLQTLTFQDRNYSAELLRDQLVAACRTNPVAASSNNTMVDLRPACDTLAHWDLHATPTSRGELLWSEFFNRAALVPGGIFADTFDPNRPLETPSRLNATNPAVWTALADAVEYLQSKGLPLDAPWGDVQYVERAGDRIPIDGCQGTSLVVEQGCFNMQIDESRPDGTYEPVDGTSFVMAVTWDDHGQPQARTLLSYSQSTDPTSPWYDDQTKLYSQKQWITESFGEAQINHDLQASALTLH
jgi:acyl-homoserine-lactone acylase